MTEEIATISMRRLHEAKTPSLPSKLYRAYRYRCRRTQPRVRHSHAYVIGTHRHAYVIHTYTQTTHRQTADTVTVTVVPYQ